MFWLAAPWLWLMFSCLGIDNQLAVLHDLEDSVAFEGEVAAAHGVGLGRTLAMEDSAVAEETIAGTVGGDRAIVQCSPGALVVGLQLAALVHHCFSVAQQDHLRLAHGSAVRLAGGACSCLLEENDSGTAARFDMGCAAGDDQTAVDDVTAAIYFELLHRPPC